MIGASSGAAASDEGRLLRDLYRVALNDAVDDATCGMLVRSLLMRAILTGAVAPRMVIADEMFVKIVEDADLEATWSPRPSVSR